MAKEWTIRQGADGCWDLEFALAVPCHVVPCTPWPPSQAQISDSGPRERGRSAASEVVVDKRSTFHRGSALRPRSSLVVHFPPTLSRSFSTAAAPLSPRRLPAPVAGRTPPPRSPAWAADAPRSRSGLSPCEDPPPLAPSAPPPHARDAIAGRRPRRPRRVGRRRCVCPLTDPASALTAVGLLLLALAGLALWARRRRRGPPRTHPRLKALDPEAAAPLTLALAAHTSSLAASFSFSTASASPPATPGTAPVSPITALGPAHGYPFPSVAECPSTPDTPGAAPAAPAPPPAVALAPALPARPAVAPQAAAKHTHSHTHPHTHPFLAPLAARRELECHGGEIRTQIWRSAGSSGSSGSTDSSGSAGVAGAAGAAAAKLARARSPRLHVHVPHTKGTKARRPPKA